MSGCPQEAYSTNDWSTPAGLPPPSVDYGAAANHDAQNQMYGFLPEPTDPSLVHPSNDSQQVELGRSTTADDRSIPTTDPAESEHSQITREVLMTLSGRRYVRFHDPKDHSKNNGWSVGAWLREGPVFVINLYEGFPHGDPKSNKLVVNFSTSNKRVKEFKNVVFRDRGLFSIYFSTLGEHQRKFLTQTIASECEPEWKNYLSRLASENSQRTIANSNGATPQEGT
ncbi:hypothetical protein QFC19_001240 [Naganishia cerealis]|nr:hypothetical protein QFC19_001240 [Naganishia cerealis]